MRKPRVIKHGLRLRAWWVMRRRQSFTLQELLNVVAAGGERDAVNNLGKYIRALAKAGYLMESDARRKGDALTSNGFKEYRLVRNTGRENPIHRVGLNEVYDQNTGESYSTAEVSHA